MKPERSAGMSPQRWRQIESLFQSALEREPEQRIAFVVEACGSDSDLRQQLEKLLFSYNQAGAFLERLPLDADSASLAEGTTERDEEDPSRHLVEPAIGPYELVREIGHGGMGTVYLAVRADEHYKKQVAIKLVSRGMDTDLILARFRNERQILANLDHPNIAQLFDGGTSNEGRPYLVMEYVEGSPIDQYCRQQRLSLVERLQLVRTVCSAVHYAHQNLIVHRDIKPQNIVITTEGIPKLLDFGIAKILKPENSLDLTLSAVRPMTPEYASPEQVRGERITTATDIYSLGVLLYELLTGRWPYRVKTWTPEELARAITEQEPERPSTAVGRAEEAESGRPIPGVEAGQARTFAATVKLRRELRGDLDNIILMALRKEPHRRYPSAQEFSEDIRRYLIGLPVMAHPGTVAHRAHKFVRRHKAGVAAAALVMLSLVGGIITTTWQARVARTERTRAERRFNDVRKLANWSIFDLHDEVGGITGMTRVRQQLVGKALEYLDSLAREAGNDSSLRRELAAAYQKVADVQGNPLNPNLGDTAGALESYGKALAIQVALADADPTDLGIRRDLARSYLGIGNIQDGRYDLGRALDTYRLALAIQETLSASDPGNTRARGDVALSHYRIGSMLKASGDYVGARESCLRALAIQETLSAAAPTDMGIRRDLARSYKKIGEILVETGNLAEALEFHRKAVGMREELSAADPTNAGDRHGLSTAYAVLGNAFAKSGNLASALESHYKALRITEEMSAADPNNAQARWQLGLNHNSVGDNFTRSGNAAGALAHHQKALALFTALSDADPTNEFYRYNLANTHQLLGDAHATLASGANTAPGKRREQWGKARSWYQRSSDIYLDMRDRGKLTGEIARDADRVSRAIAKCDAAAARLKTR